MLKKDLINILKVLDIVQWVLVGVGAALSLSMLIWFVLHKKKINPSTSVEPIYVVKGKDYLVNIFIDLILMKFSSFLKKIRISAKSQDPVVKLYV